MIKENKNLTGLNVTAPYKEEVISYIDELDVSAKKINAVNVIKIIRNSGKLFLKGYNTDIYGFKKSLSKRINPEIKSALVLGTGGAAKAVSAALKDLNISFKFVSRTKKAEEYLLYHELTKDIIYENLLIVNATPLGIYPEINALPDIPYDYISEKHILFDLIYNPSETKFLNEGKKRNAQIINGLEMLQLQADKAWEIFNIS